jgi:hypothetical protein
MKEAKRSYSPIATYDFAPTSEFSFLISRYYSADKVCRDDKRGRLEEKLNNFIIILIKMALQIKDERIAGNGRIRPAGIVNKNVSKWKI